jgi:hypothetical protein
MWEDVMLLDNLCAAKELGNGKVIRLSPPPPEVFHLGKWGGGGGGSQIPWSISTVVTRMAK